MRAEVHERDRTMMFAIKAEVRDERDMGRYLIAPIAVTLAALLLMGQAQPDDRTICERSSGGPAIEACTRAISSGAFTGLELAKLHTNRGVELKQRGDLDAALNDYDESIRLNPRDFFAFNNRANVRRDKGDISGAIADYSEAVRLEPAYAAAYTSRGLVHERAGDLEMARESFNAALSAPANKFRNSPGAHQIARERLRVLSAN
jgi:tetratricopeptide (TPR) repeat protein